VKAAIVNGAGQSPVYGDFREPVPAAGERIVKVTAAAISPVVKSRASGAHYSASNQFPFVVGFDGVGRLEDGSRVYFIQPAAPFGSMAERVVVPPTQCLALPDGLDDVTAAAIAIPGMSSWAALIERAKFTAGETVLINGATGTSGRLAVQVAKHLGAGKIIATGRDAGALASLVALGADVTIPLAHDDDELEGALRTQFAGGVNVVIDYLWGRSAERILIAAANAGKVAEPIRFVEVGSASGADLTLPSAVLRSAAIELTGSGMGSIAPRRFVQAIDGVLRAAIPGGFQIMSKAVALSDVEQAWPADDSKRRTVLTI
jgi:NADPH:quinone reductase-like Zn-dependent oxidoreductase